MIKIEDIKKLIEADKSLKYKEVPQGILILQEAELDTLFFTIKSILKNFGVKDENLTVTDEGTLISTPLYDSMKLKMLLSPFYELGEMKVLDPYKLLLVGVYIDTLNSTIDGQITEDEDASADGSADDLGEVPTENNGVLEINDLANQLDELLGGNVDIAIVDENSIEIGTDENVVKVIKDNADIFDGYDVEITDNTIKITKKG